MSIGPDPGFVPVSERELIDAAGRVARRTGLSPADAQLLAYLTVRYGPQFVGIVRQVYRAMPLTGKQAAWLVAAFGGGFGLARLIFH